jgi:hypothetical protein
MGSRITTSGEQRKTCGELIALSVHSILVSKTDVTDHLLSVRYENALDRKHSENGGYYSDPQHMASCDRE